MDEMDAYCAEALIDDDGNELVTEDSGCPCGERRMDWLVWIDDDRVKCATCGHSYNPKTGEAYFE